MEIEFTYKGMQLWAEVFIKRPVDGKFGFHPDDCDEGEEGKILVNLLECDGYDAAFLMDSDFASEIEDAAYNAAVKKMTAQELFDQAFNQRRDPRSHQYRQGCLYILRLKMGECPSEPFPYPIGTAHADAWFFGAQEGHLIYQAYRDSVSAKP